MSTVQEHLSKLQIRRLSTYGNLLMAAQRILSTTLQARKLSQQQFTAANFDITMTSLRCRMNRGGSQKSLNPTNTEKKKVSWTDQVTSGIQILQNFTSVSFLECTQIKLIVLLLVGMLISHINLTQSITPLYLRSVSVHMHRVRKQPSQICANYISTKTPGIQFRNSASYTNKLLYVLSNHYTWWSFETHFLKKEDRCLKLIMFRSPLLKRERWTVLLLPWEHKEPIQN